MMVTGGGAAYAITWGPKALASAGAVLGAGVDLSGRSLVITEGAAKFGAEVISAQWFDRDGTATTDEFRLLSNFTPGASTWFEAVPLVGNGLIVRRIDMDASLHSVAVALVGSGVAQVGSAPDWMTSRHDVQVVLARGVTAYATLPYGAQGVACSQRVEVVGADGTSCGARDYPIASGSCDTGDMTLGMDGTIIQPLPSAMETTTDAHGAHTCTWRWWPGAVR